MGATKQPNQLWFVKVVTRYLDHPVPRLANCLRSKIFTSVRSNYNLQEMINRNIAEVWDSWLSCSRIAASLTLTSYIWSKMNVNCQREEFQQDSAFSEGIRPYSMSDSPCALRFTSDCSNARIVALQKIRTSYPNKIYGPVTMQRRPDVSSHLGIEMKLDPKCFTFCCTLSSTSLEGFSNTKAIYCVRQDYRTIFWVAGST